MLRAVLFDLGETLVHLDRPWDDIFRANLCSLHSYLDKEGLSSSFETFARVFTSVFEQASAMADFYKIETPIQDIVERVLRKLRHKGLSEELIREAIVEFYTPEVAAWQLYPDAVETLHALRDDEFEMGLVSNAKSEWLIHSILKRHDLRKFFKVVVVSAELRIRKPRVEIFEHALKSLDAKPDETVFLGDRLNTDMFGARIVGMHSIRVFRKSTATSGLMHPDATVTSLSDALKQIVEWRTTPIRPVPTSK